MRPVNAFIAVTTCVLFLHGCGDTPPGPGPSPGPSPSPGPGPPTSVEEYLRMIDAHFDNQPQNPKGLIQTYGPKSIGGGDCAECELPEPCPNFGATPHCRFDVYDNALAVTYYTKRGKVKEAERILGGFIDLLYPPNKVPYAYGPDEGLPSGRYMTLLAASYSNLDAKAGDYSGPGVSDGTVDVGNNAWVGMAFARYAAATGSACHGTVARDILHIINMHAACNDKLDGFMGRLPPTLQYYRSSEHNIDMFALARMLGADEVKKSAQTFVLGMYGQDDDFNGAYVTGTGANGSCDPQVESEAIAADAQLWNLAAGVDPTEAHYTSALGFALQEQDGNDLQGLWRTDMDLIGNNGSGQGETYYGFRFSNRGNGIQWELTASGLIAMVRYRALYGEKNGVSTNINQTRDSLKRLLNHYRSVPASVLGGNYAAYRNFDHQAKYPGGSDTGLGWTYLRYPHVASTAWTGFALMFQGADGDEIDELANPYNPPDTAVPGPVENGSCLPAEQEGPPASLLV